MRPTWQLPLRVQLAVVAVIAGAAAAMTWHPIAGVIVAGYLGALAAETGSTVRTGARVRARVEAVVSEDTGMSVARLGSHGVVVGVAPAGVQVWWAWSGQMTWTAARALEVDRSEVVASQVAATVVGWLVLFATMAGGAP